MSDSELSDAPSIDMPPDSKVESTLKQVLKKAARGPPDDYTVSKIRKTAEELLDLPEGFFKGDDKWKARSKAIIENHVAAEHRKAELEAQSTPSPASKSKANPTAKRGSTAAKSQPRKKQKLDSDNETSDLSSPPSGSEDDFEEDTKPKKRAENKKPAASKPQNKPQPKSKAKSKAVTKDSEDETGPQEKPDDDENEANESGSEMSVVLDEAPAKKARGKSKSVDPSDKKPKASKPKAKPSNEADPDQEEIKKLQGWLVKCGIRKVWGKELKPYETSKAKIKHLRGMLEATGMTGRYSNEKAAQIKEARELAADIEAVQEGNERWGKEGDDDNDADGDRTRSGRRLVRGAKNYDFLSSDGEETD